MNVTVIESPEPVVTWEVAKAHLRLDSEDDRGLVEVLIDAATVMLDAPQGRLGRALGRQTLEARFDEFECTEIDLAFPPIVAVTSVKYLDTSNLEQTFDASNYQVLSDGRILLNRSSRWPGVYDTEEAVRVRYEAGYDDVPAALVQAILQIVAYLYENREASSADVFEGGVLDGLLRPYRVGWGIA